MRRTFPPACTVAGISALNACLPAWYAMATLVAHPSRACDLNMAARSTTNAAHSKRHLRRMERRSTCLPLCLCMWLYGLPVFSLC